MTADALERVDVLGVPISPVSLASAVDLILGHDFGALSVAVCNVHTVMTARRDPRLRAAIEEAELATPDGMPLVWALRSFGHPTQERVDGFRLFHETVRTGLPDLTRHFFYGSTQGTLDGLTEALESEYPGVEIAGTLSPPFCAQTSEEQANDFNAIRAAAPDVVWIGLGMPKQELWIAGAKKHLSGVSLVGVGAVFDWIAGGVPKAPVWMQRTGLEWLYRLIREPRRLWRRYAWNNPAYLALLGAQIIRSRWSRARP